MSDSGHATMYACILMPIMIGLGALAVDASGWNALRDDLQQEADKVAFQAASQLPDRDAVQRVIEAHQARLSKKGITLGPPPRLNKNLSLENEANAYFERDRLGVAVLLSSSFRGLFSSMIPEEFKENGVFSVHRASAARVVPSDTVLIIADSANLRPGGNLNACSLDSPWGAERDWPASGYFNAANPPKTTGEALVECLNKSWDEASFQRWMTQFCFNPVYSAVKDAARHLAITLSSFGDNRISVIFTPGDETEKGFSFVRHIYPESVVKGETYYEGNIGGFYRSRSTTAKAHWIDAREHNNFFGDHLCVLLSQVGAEFGGDYEISLQDSAHTSCPNPIAFPPSNEPHSSHPKITDPSHTLLSECFFLEQSLTLDQAIYWHSARAGDQKPQILTALRQALMEFSAKAEVLEDEASVRKNLAGAAFRRVIVLTDTLPDLISAKEKNQLAAFLQAFEQLGAEIVIAAFSHPGFGWNASKENRLNSAVTAIAKLVSAKDIAPRTLRIIRTKSAEELRDSVTPRVLALGKRIALKR